MREKRRNREKIISRKLRSHPERKIWRLGLCLEDQKTDPGGQKEGTQKYTGSNIQLANTLLKRIRQFDVGYESWGLKDEGKSMVKIKGLTKTSEFKKKLQKYTKNKFEKIFSKFKKN
jgi:hypothetical protein